MKVLWVCNLALPEIAKELGINIAASGGWLSGTLRMLKEHSCVQLIICFPQTIFEDVICREIDGVCYYGFPAGNRLPYVYDPQVEGWIRQIINASNPDLLHIWGTEYAHSVAAARAFGDTKKTIVSIQGLCGYIARHCKAFLPQRLQKVCTVRDLLKNDRLSDQHMKYVKRGRNEELVLKNAGHIIGRTRWDYACVSQIVPDVRYYQCNETMRKAFYVNAGSWKYENCEKHSIFVSQANIPLKGFHLLLEAMPVILSRYPDARIYTTGVNLFELPFYKVNGYQLLLMRMISRLGLKDKVVFLGLLDEDEMTERYLRSNVFVSASSIENSPNSVAEAMLLGVPTVASYVGGTMDLLTDREEGFLYQADAPYMLADYVCRMFADVEMATRMGKNATAHAKITHDPEKNLRTLLEIYKEVLQA